MDRLKYHCHQIDDDQRTTMKAIIPVAGAGTQLRPITYTQPKPLIPVAGKPIISFIIEKLQQIGVDDFVFVIGYLGDKIRDYIDETYPELKKNYVQQEERLGTGHAVWTARHLIKDAKELIIFLGDTIVEMNFEKLIKTPVSCLVVSKVSEPREFGIVELDNEKRIKRLVEKPRIPHSNLAMVGLYKILEVEALLEALTYNIQHGISSEGEYSLTDAFQRMLEKGIPFATLNVKNWFDCGKMRSLLATNAILLDQEGYASMDLPAFENTILIHPVSIGRNCEIVNSIIGPHVTIGNNVRITNSIVEESIIGHYTSLQQIVLKNSVIGNDSSVTGFKHSLNIGDNTEIDFS